MNSAKIFSLALLMIFLCVISSGQAKDVQPLDGFYEKRISRSVSNSNNVVLFNQKHSMLCFSIGLESTNPKLVQALSDYNLELIREANRAREQISELAQKKYDFDPTQQFYPFYSESELYIRRADSAVVSVINSFSDYGGGAHGMHGWLGASFDAETGKRLTISDICTNAERLHSVLIDRLHREHENGLFNDAESTVLKLIAEEKINFVLEPRGVLFIFNPYEIAPYAAGMLTTFVLFDEVPELFKAKYQKHTAAYAQSIPMYYPTSVEIRNGTRSNLTVSRDEDRVVVELDGRQITAHLTNIQAISYAHTADGGNFLYINATAEADGFSAVEGECISIFKLNGELELVDRMPYTFRRDSEDWLMITNPNSIQFDSAMPVGDRYSHFGAINSDGTFSFG